MHIKDYSVVLFVWFQGRTTVMAETGATQDVEMAAGTEGALTTIATTKTSWSTTSSIWTDHVVPVPWTIHHTTLTTMDRCLIMPVTAHTNFHLTDNRRISRHFGETLTIEMDRQGFHISKGTTGTIEIACRKTSKVIVIREVILDSDRGHGDTGPVWTFVISALKASGTHRDNRTTPRLNSTLARDTVRPVLRAVTTQTWGKLPIFPTRMSKQTAAKSTNLPPGGRSKWREILKRNRMPRWRVHNPLEHRHQSHQGTLMRPSSISNRRSNDSNSWVSLVCWYLHQWYLIWGPHPCSPCSLAISLLQRAPRATWVASTWCGNWHWGLVSLPRHPRFRRYLRRCTRPRGKILRTFWPCSVRAETTPCCSARSVRRRVAPARWMSPSLCYLGRKTRAALANLS